MGLPTDLRNNYEKRTNINKDRKIYAAHCRIFGILFVPLSVALQPWRTSAVV